MLVALAAVPAPRAHAATFNVTEIADTPVGACDASCTLREAVVAANATPGFDVIVVPAGTYNLSSFGVNEDAAATGDLDITERVEIVGAGSDAATGTTVNAAGIDRVFHVLGFAADQTAFHGLRLIGGNSTAGVDPDGGAIRIENVDVRAFDVAFEGNIGANGGAIFNGGDASPQLTLSGVSFTANVAVSDGGAIFNGDNVLDGKGILHVIGATFTGNRAGSEGGAIKSEDDAKAIVLDSVFSGNLANRGGAIFNRIESAFSLLDSTVSGNQAATDGGGINNQNDASLTLVRTAVSDNTAGTGGGGIYHQNNATLSLVDSTISGNRANGPDPNGGGGMNIRNSSTTSIERSTISGNTTAGTGGGIFAENGAFAVLRNSTISGNQAAGNGGGVRAEDRTLLRLLSVTLSGNSTGGSGGGIANDLDPAQPSAPRPLSLRDTIVVGNSAAVTGPECADSSGLGFTSLGHNLDSGTGCGLSGPGDIQNADAGLGPLAANGGPTLTHALLPGSPAIDAGSASCPAVDQRGAARPQGASCDVGAFEAPPSTTVPPGVTIAVRAAVLKPGKLVKFVARGSFPLPDPATDDPTAAGAALTFAGATGSAVYALPAPSWKRLGRRTTRGFRFRGAPCRKVVVKPTVITGVCRGATGTLSLPETGPVDMVLTVGTGTRYCGRCGGTARGNPAKVFRSNDCQAPPACP